MHFILFSFLLYIFNLASSTNIELSSTSAAYYFTLNSSNPQESYAIFITSQSSFINNTFQYSSLPFSFSNFVKAVDILPTSLNITAIFPNTWTYQNASNNLQNTSFCSNHTFYDCSTNLYSYEICSLLAPTPPQYGLKILFPQTINCSSQAISPCDSLTLSDYYLNDSQGNSFFMSQDQLCPETDIQFTFTISVYGAYIPAMSNLIGPGDLTLHYLSLESASLGSWNTAVSTLRIERPSDIVNGVDLEKYSDGDFSYLGRNEIESVVQTKLIKHTYGSDVYCQYEVNYTGVIRGIYINDYPSSNHMPREYSLDSESNVVSNLSFLLRANQVNMINIVGYRLTNTTLTFVNCQDQWNNGNSVPNMQFLDYNFGEVLLDQLDFSISANILASCPASCAQCTFSGVCVKCNPGKNLVYGTCVLLCPAPFSFPDYKQVCNSILESTMTVLGPPQIVNEEEVTLTYYDDFGFTNQRVMVLHTTNEVGLGASPYVWPSNSAPLVAESVVIFLPTSSLGVHSVTIPFKSIANSSLLSLSNISHIIDYPWNNYLTPLTNKVFAVIYPLMYENYLVGTYWNQAKDPESLTSAQQKSPHSSSPLKNRRYQYLAPTGFYIFQAFVECIEDCQVEVSCDGQVQLYKNEQISLFNVDFKSTRWTYSYTQNLTGSVYLKFIVTDAQFFQPFISGNNFLLYPPGNPTSILPIGPLPVDQPSSCYIPNCQVCQDDLCLSCQQGSFLSINQTECLTQCPQTEFFSTAESTCEASCAAAQLLNETDNECIPVCEEPGYYYTADLGCQVCVEDCKVCLNATSCLECMIDSPLNTETFCFRRIGTLFELKDFSVEQTVSIKRDSTDTDLALVITDQGSFGNFSFFFDDEGRGIPRILKVLKMQENDTYSTATIPALNISEPGFITTHYLKIQQDDSGQNFSSTGFLGVYYKDFPLYQDVPQIDAANGPLQYNYPVNDYQGLSYPDLYYKTVIVSRMYEHNETSEIMCSLKITFYGDLRGVYINGELVFAHSTSNNAYVTKTSRSFKVNPNEMFLVSFIGYRIQLQQVDFTACVETENNLAVVPSFTSYLLTGPSTNSDDFFVLNNTFCGDNCASCLDQATCVQCENTFYLQNGICVPSCPSSHMQLIYGFCGAKERSQGFLFSNSYSSSSSLLTVGFHMPLGMDLQFLVRVHPFVVSSTSIGTYIAQGNSPSLSQGAYQLMSFVKSQTDFTVSINVESIVSGVTGPVDLIISTVRSDLILFSVGGNLTYVPIGTVFSLMDDQIYYWDFFMNCSSPACQLNIQGQGNVEILLNERTFVFTAYLDDSIGNFTLKRNFATGLQHLIIKAYNATKFSFGLSGNYSIYSQGDLVNHNTISAVQYQLFNGINCNNGFQAKCYSCQDGYFLNPTTGYCTANCPSGTIAFLPERICTTNSSGLVKRGTYYIFNCTENPGYYYTIDQGCVYQCDQTCLTCSGPLNSHCLACPYPRLLESTNQTCLCPVGTQDDPISGGCMSVSYVNLTGSSSEIYCDNLTLKADIRADELQAYNITFYWRLESQGTSASMISQAQFQAYLDTQFSQNIQIAGAYLENNQAYNFTVHYINAVNKTIQDWKVYNISYSVVPNFTIYGDSIGIKNSIDHQFYAEFTQNTTCSNLNNNPASVLTSVWTVISDDDGSIVYSSSGYPLEITLPGCTLLPQSSYTLNLQMSLLNTSSSFTEQNLTLVTYSEIFEAVILNNSQNCLADADLTLEGTIVYASNCSIRAPGQILYTWFCENQTQPCDDPLGLFGVSSTSQQLAIPKLTFHQGDNLIFTLEIEKNGDAQNSSSLQISIDDPTALFLQISCEDTSCFQYATNEDYLIYGNVQTAFGFNLSSSELSKLNFTWTITPQIPFAYFLGTLKLFSNSLNLTTVNFLTVTFTVQNSTRTFTRSLNLPINHPPVLGILQVSPSSGISLFTQFIITTDSWYDPDTPLTYQFSYSFPADTVLTPLQSSYSASPQITTILPGQYSGSLVNIWVSVKDYYGAESIASTQVQVSPQIQTLQQAINSYNQLLLTAQAQDDPFQIAQITAMITKEITQWEDTLTEGAPNLVCPSCSGHGSCPVNVARCDCEAGWAIIDCYVQESDVDLISNLKQSLLGEVSASYQQMLSNSSQEEITTVRGMIYQILMESVDDQHFNTNSSLILVQNILNSMVNTTVFSSDEIQAISQILSDMMEFSSTYDCTGSTSFTKDLEEKVQEYLEIIAESSLSDQIANQNATVITTDNLEMYFQKLSICSLDNKTVTTSASSPQVTISVNSGVDLQDCSSQVNLEYYAFNDNLLNCSAEVNANKTLTILGIDITNASTGTKINSSSISVTIDFGGNPAKNCPSSCQLVSANVCSCGDLSPFDVGNQLVKVFQNSNLSYLKNARSVLTFQFWKTGSFWMVFALTAWFFITLGVIRYKLLTYNVMNKIRQCNKISKRNVISPLLKVTHPLATIYLIPKYERLSKSARALVFYTRNLLLLSFTSLFSGPPRSEVAYDYQQAFQISFNFNIYLILLPYFTIQPLVLIVKFLMKDLGIQKSQFSKTSKGKIAYFILKHVRLWVVLLVVFCNFVIILIVNANQTPVQRIAWTVNFIGSLLQDLILTPSLYLAFQYCLFRIYCNQFFAKKYPLIHKFLPRVFNEFIQEIFVIALNLPPCLIFYKAKLNGSTPAKVQAKRIKILPISSDNSKGPEVRKASSDNDTIISGLGASDNSLNFDGLLGRSPQSNFKSSINLLSPKAIKEETVEESPYLPRPRPSNLIDFNDKYSSVNVSRRNSDSVDFDLISKRSQLKKGAGKLLIDLQDDSPEWTTPRHNSKRFLSKQLKIPSSIEVLSPKMEGSSETHPLFNLNHSLIPQRKDSMDSQIKMINSKDFESPSNYLYEARNPFTTKRNTSGGSQYQTFTENSNIFMMDEVRLSPGRNTQTPKGISLLRDEALTFSPRESESKEIMVEKRRLSQDLKSEIMMNKMKMVDVLRRAQKNRQKRSSLFQSLGKGSGIQKPLSAGDGSQGVVSEQEGDQMAILHLEN